MIDTSSDTYSFWCFFEQRRLGALSLFRRCASEAEGIKDRECFGLAALQALQRLPPGVPLESVGGRCVVWVLVPSLASQASLKGLTSMRRLHESLGSLLRASLGNPDSRNLVGPGGQGRHREAAGPLWRVGAALQRHRRRLGRGPHRTRAAAGRERAQVLPSCLAHTIRSAYDFLFSVGRGTAITHSRSPHEHPRSRNSRTPLGDKNLLGSNLQISRF